MNTRILEAVITESIIETASANHGLTDGQARAMLLSLCSDLPEHVVTILETYITRAALAVATKHQEFINPNLETKSNVSLVMREARNELIVAEVTGERLPGTM